MPGSETDKTAFPGQPGRALAGRFTPGQMIAGRFAVMRYLARGGMGEVYEVEDHLLQKVRVALKVILPGIACDASSSQRFEQEVLLARKVVHPNLCPIYDLARCDDPEPSFLFLTMKLLPGETLAARLRRRRGPIPREEAIAISTQLVAGLAAIHRAGIIHRDIKPNNVMLDGSGPQLGVCIMDFGLARLHDGDLTIAAGSLMAGTPGYMAPEILQGQGPSRGADLFALGVLLHEVLTGEPPRFRPGSLHIETTPKLDRTDIPPLLVHAVREFLASEPGRRSHAFEQLKTALSVSSAGQSDAAGAAFSHPAARRLSRREFAAGSLLAACAVGGGVAWKWNRVYDLLHPLPAKRFVALVGWPAAAGAQLQATISSVVDAIGSELVRAEAFDHKLLILPHTLDKEVTSLKELDAIRESAGANLILAASGSATAKRFELLLRLIDPASSRTIREKMLFVHPEDRLKLPEMAVRSAAEVLDITGFRPDDQRSQVGTTHVDAYAAFQAAESLRKQDNDAGLEAAIGKYKEAIEADPTYADAQAGLSSAYYRFYALNNDGAALILARANAKAAIQHNPSLVTAHLALASVDQTTGDAAGAAKEMAKALSLDPENPNTLIDQANFYAAAGQWREAEETFARVFTLRPNYWLAHNQLGVVLDQQAKYQQALLEFRSASLAAPGDARTLANVGAAYLQLGDTRQAASSFEKSYQLSRNGQAAAGLAATSRIEGQLPAAIKYALDAVTLEPTETSDWLELGDCYAALRADSKQAAAAYARALEVQREHVRNEPKAGAEWMLLALCLCEAGDHGAVPGVAEKAERLGANDVESQLLKVRILALLHSYDEALASVSSLLARGATVFQFQTMPDLGALRRDPRYQRIVAAPGREV